MPKDNSLINLKNQESISNNKKSKKFGYNTF